MQVVDLYDDATPCLRLHMPPALQARILVKKARVNKSQHDADNDPLAVILKVSREMEKLLRTHPGSASLSLSQIELKIAKAFCHYYIPETETPAIPSGRVRTRDALSGAIILGNLSLVKSLLGKTRMAIPALLNSGSVFFGYPLHLAAAWGHLDIVCYFL